MKKITKRYFSLFIFIIFSIFLSKSQNIIEYDKDTLITISPKQVDIINGIIIDFENSKKNIELYKDIVKLDSISLSKKDSIIFIQNSMFNKKEDYYKVSIENLENSIKDEKRKRKFTNSILGGAAIILGILFIVK